MYKSDIFILLFTFIIGACAGAFLYVTTFVPLFGSSSSDIAYDEEAANEMSVIGRAYDGMTVRGYIHPSFRIAGNGTYHYIPGGVDERGEEREGALPRDLWQALSRELANADFSTLARPAEGKQCRIAADGTEYTYQVVIEGRGYTLDTCETALPYSHPLALTLAEVWRYFADGSYTLPEGSSGSGYSWGGASGYQGGARIDIAGWLEAKLQSYFTSQSER